MFINQFPYMDAHELNLDWVIHKIKTLEIDMKEFKGINDIKYDGVWDITKQYEAWTVVNFNKEAYMSIKPVPSGVDITNSDYWVYVSEFKIDMSLSGTSLNPVANRVVTAKFNQVDSKADALDTKITTKIAEEKSAREAADAALQSEISNESTERAQADASLSNRIDTIISSATVDSEVIDIRTNAEGITYASAGAAVRALEGKVNAIQNYAFIADSYVHLPDGNFRTATNRSRTDYLPCGEGVSVTYAGETSNSSVAGIAFFDSMKTFISGYGGNGNDGVPVTVTSPSGTKYAIVSLKNTNKVDFVFSPAVGGLSSVASDLYGKVIRNNSYLPIVTDGTNRSSNYDVNGLAYVEIVDPDYEVSVYNSDGVALVSWSTSINISDYATADHIKVRRADNENMAAGTAVEVIKGYTESSFIQYDFFNSRLGAIGYVDCDSGSDSNSGLGRGFALKTIQAAIDKNFERILIKPGEYAEAVSKSNFDKIFIEVDEYYSDFNSSTNPNPPLVIIDATGNSNGLSLQHGNQAVLKGIKVINAEANGFYLRWIQNIDATYCIAEYVAEMGFQIRDTNGIFRDCNCNHIGTMGGGQHHDGFNIHDTGSTCFINCSASYCEDDGISHHDACTGMIDGGEWHHCGKGGIASPTAGAVIDVKNVYSHDNQYGIYCSASDEFNRVPVNFSNCACKNNSIRDISINTGYTANVWNCIYSSISSGDNVNIIS